MDEGRDKTLHQRILTDIEGNIVSGRWPPGTRIPFEVDLAERYGCSRMTVNKVLSQLAKAGLIERRRKSGSFVTQPQAQSAVLEIHDIQAEVQSLNLPYAFSLIGARKRLAKAEDLRRLDLDKGASLFEVTCLHQAGGHPFCLEERLINLATVPDAATADFTILPPGPWLVSQVPWSTAEHRIQAIGASADAAAALHLPRGTPCLVVERRTWSQEGPVTHVRFTYPGDRHALVARFTPASST
ncbi:histidine utilization repressor [Xaviernesmea oryzae]|uniref:Histidine utilization repressor n=1 Tax=Xaviernesmea oryzae TaxID=464029 RepID=A0A1Q9B0Y7_9HYPH|nr:histidine utilization repressor [Xaviernesmea oryzae]OLP61663.1 histidine utilization repressor [Xaviernesmea oryzae]SEL03787.1 GntR family transcriptional regulator, histidine utilization repressor [Xaviernesmea oryzae]